MCRIQVPLKAHKHLANLVCTAKIGKRIGNGVVLAKAQQWRQLFSVKFFDALFHVLREHEVHKRLLLVGELLVRLRLGHSRPFRAGAGRQGQGERHKGQNIELTYFPQLPSAKSRKCMFHKAFRIV